MSNDGAKPKRAAKVMPADLAEAAARLQPSDLRSALEAIRHLESTSTLNGVHESMASFQRALKDIERSHAPLREMVKGIGVNMQPFRDLQEAAKGAREAVPRLPDVPEPAAFVALRDFEPPAFETNRMLGKLVDVQGDLIQGSHVVASAIQVVVTELQDSSRLQRKGLRLNWWILSFTAAAVVLATISLAVSLSSN